MHIGKKKKLLIAIIVMFINVFFIVATRQSYLQNIDLSFDYVSENGTTLQVYHSNSKNGFSEDKSILYKDIVGKKNITITIPVTTNWIRVDFADDMSTENKLQNFQFEKGSSIVSVAGDNREVIEHEADLLNNEAVIEVSGNGNDSYIVLSLDKNEINECLVGGNKSYISTGILLCGLFNVILIVVLLFTRKNEFTKEILRNRKLIWNLSVNDFKTKFSGSFFGIFWAFVSPVVTILVYWFVFQVGLRSAPMGDIPFVLWLIAGIVPWFFFQDALTCGTNSLIDYSYLVKKVVFQIDILPIVKIVSSLFVHVFFIGFALIVFCFYGLIPNLYTLQIIYYLFAMIVFVLSLSFLTCSLVVFFKDLGQIIQIFMQVGVWMTPILWNSSMIPAGFEWVFKLNPMYYIVDGYRDALINDVWFWEKGLWTVGFWVATIAIMIIGIRMFRKLKIHFADVL